MPPVPSGIGKHLREDKPCLTSRRMVAVSVGSSLSVACSFPLESSILWALRSTDAARAAGVGLIPRRRRRVSSHFRSLRWRRATAGDAGAVVVFASAPPSKITETKLRRQGSLGDGVACFRSRGRCTTAVFTFQRNALPRRAHRLIHSRSLFVCLVCL